MNLPIVHCTMLSAYQGKITPALTFILAQIAQSSLLCFLRLLCPFFVVVHFLLNFMNLERKKKLKFSFVNMLIEERST